MRKSTIKKLIALGVLFFILGVLLILKNNQDVCEFFATTLSRAWIFLFGNLFGWLPFSLFELLLICAISGGVVFVVFVIIHLAKRRWQSLLSLTLAVAIAVVSFVNVYTATASFAYNRKPLPSEVYAEYSSENFTYEEAVQLATILADKLNYAYEHTEHDENGNVVYPYDFNEMSALLAEEYKRLPGDYFSSYTPRAKKIINKWIMSQLHITGVFFAPFGEANVNGNENGMYMPVTMAHEMAHGKGVMQEYQADIVAYYVTATSDNPYISYGALATLTGTALNMLAYYPTLESENQKPFEKINEIQKSINKGVSKEQRNYAEFWSQFTLLDDMGDFFNDIYLKLQKQEEGTQSYHKPTESQGTGVSDDWGHEIIFVASFSGTQNLLINLFKQGLLQ